MRPAPSCLLPTRDGLARIERHGADAAFAVAGLVACIPARDEEERIAACLAAADRDLAEGDAVVVFANGCSDATVPRALEILHGVDRPWLLLDGDWRAGEGSAPLARRLAMETAHGLSPDAHLLSIDGDTMIRPGLRAAYRQAFDDGYDLVCGAIGFLQDEAALLPPADPVQQATVRDYRTLSARVVAWLDPDPDNPWPHHGNIGGANFAIRGAAYARIGGLPTPASGEDRALRRLCEGHGLRIRYSSEALVETSCRLDGRARGGLADELLHERTQDDPLVDELLEPSETLVLRTTTRRAFLSAQEPTARAQCLLDLGLAGEAAMRLAVLGGGLAWQAAEDVSPRLARRRLRLSDLRRHLPELRRRLDAIERDRGDSPGPAVRPAS